MANAIKNAKVTCTSCMLLLRLCEISFQLQWGAVWCPCGTAGEPGETSCWLQNLVSNSRYGPGAVAFEFAQVGKVLVPVSSF